MRARDRAARAAAVVVAVLVGAATVLTGLAVLPGLPAPAAADEHASVEITVRSVDPAVLRPGEDQRVRVEITNDGARAVERPRLLLHLDRRSFISRSSLDRWRTAATTDPVGSAVAQLDLEEPLPPGASTTATLVLPAASVGLRTGETSWGPRGMAVEVVDLDDPARRRLDLARTFLLWFPVEEVTPTRVTVLVPLVGPPVDPWHDGWVGELDDLTSPEGRLGRVLGATARHRHVTWAVDPWLVDVTAGPVHDEAPDDADGPEGGAEDEGAGEGGENTATNGTGAADGEAPGAAEEPDGDEGVGPADGPGTDGAAPENGPVLAPVGVEAGPQAHDWAQDLLDALTGRDVELLPYLDPDLAALAHAGEEDLLGRARERAAEVARASALPDGARATLAWPADALPDVPTAVLGSASTTTAGRAVVVGPGRLLPPAVLTYTPSGRTTVPTPGGDVAVLVPDERLSAAVRTGDPLADPLTDEPDRPAVGTERTGGPGEEDVRRTPSPAVAAQDVLAELAVVTRERPSDGRHLLATVPRDWDPEPEVAGAVLGALGDAPWVRTEGVSALVGAPDPEVERGTLPTRSVHDDELAPAEIEATVDEVARREALAQVVADPGALLGDTELEVLAPLSVAWRAEPVARSVLATRGVAATQALQDGVAVLPGATVNLISATGGLPVRVTNSLPQDATVEVGLRPGDARLRADRTVTAVVPAGGEQTVQVPVHAIQSADVEVAVELRTPAGELVDDDTVLLVRVRADWEGIGTAIIAGLLALGMVVGLVRAVRQGRRTGRRAQPQRLGPDALSPEAQEAEESEAEETPGRGADAGAAPTTQARAGGT